MQSTKREAPPGDFKSWQEFNKAKKERRHQKMDLKLQRMDEKKKKAEARARAVAENSEKQPLSTLSIAVPGSILDNAQSVELRTYLAGQIARAACVFKVDEVVVYDDQGIQDNATTHTIPSLSDDGEFRPARRCCAQLARILQYLECPQYLRREFFPKHRDLEYAGLLNPLDAPHHVRQHDDVKFREGVVLNQPAKSGCYVNVGLLKSVKVARPLQPGVRVTVEMLPAPSPDAKRLFGRVVAPSYPRQACGIYWGYSVRLANSLSAVFSQCPYKEGYDMTIGTSERGEPVESMSVPKHKHAIVVFGGLAGLEAALESDEILTVDDPALLFDRYLNTCPEQGSRTIRTEEAILISLAELRTRLKPEVVFETAPSSDYSENVKKGDVESSSESSTDISLSNNDQSDEEELKLEEDLATQRKERNEDFGMSEKYEGQLANPMPDQAIRIKQERKKIKSVYAGENCNTSQDSEKCAKRKDDNLVDKEKITKKVKQCKNKKENKHKA